MFAGNWAVDIDEMCARIKKMGSAIRSAQDEQGTESHIRINSLFNCKYKLKLKLVAVELLLLLLTYIFSN